MCIQDLFHGNRKILYHALWTTVYTISSSTLQDVDCMYLQVTQFKGVHWLLQSLYHMNMISRYLDGLLQHCSVSSALAMEIQQFCTKPSIFYIFFWPWSHIIQKVLIVPKWSTRTHMFWLCDDLNQISTVSDNGVAPNRWQAITWTNADLIRWLRYVAQGEMN